MEVLKAPFDPKAGKKVKPKDAARWTKNYRLKPRKHGDTPTLAQYFGKEFLQRILDENSCAGLRIYQAIDDEGTRRVLVVGVDAKGNDLIGPINEDGTLPDDGGGIVGDTPMSCPSTCDTNSLLMQ
jgi:hypothetical protein